MTHPLSDLLRGIRTLALMPSRHVISAWRSSVNILRPQILPSKSRTVSTLCPLPRPSAPPLRIRVGGETSEITHRTNVNESPHPHETVTGIESGIGTGKGIGKEIVIGETATVDGMELRRRGSEIENERGMVLQGGHTKGKKKRKNHQSHSLPLSPGLSARCLTRQSLMVQCLERTTCCKFSGMPSFQTSTDQGPPPQPLPHDRLGHPQTMVHTKVPAGVPGDGDVIRRAISQLVAKTRQEHQARHLRSSFLLACIFSILSFTLSSPL